MVSGVSLFAQTTQLAPDAPDRLAVLLNRPVMVQPVTAEPVGGGWFRVVTDAHVFSDQVSVRQVASVLLDRENQSKIYDGKKSKLTATVVSLRADEAILDFVTISVGALGFQNKTPYRAAVKTTVLADNRIALEVRQLPEDSASNNRVKNLFATRYAEEIALNGKTYTYIRIYTIDEVNASLLPNAKNALERSSGPVNEETLQLIIDAAKTR